MSFKDLRTFIKSLEMKGELLRIKNMVDPNQEINIIQHKVSISGGPAILFENVKGSSYRVLSNLFGTRSRVNLVFGRSPCELGNNFTDVIKAFINPSIKSIFREKYKILSLGKARIKNVRNAPIKECNFDNPDLESIPVLTCWPNDGGAFFTLPLVHTTDLETGAPNLGIYRLQRFDSKSTGMHWQIEKGGGFHFDKAIKYNKALPVSVILGGPPALVISAIAPLPEGIDERLMAAYIMGTPLEVIRSVSNLHKIPASAEFVIEGSVSPGDFKLEGPFGDHFGHYSVKSHCPVFRVNNIMARKDAIYPATVVGKPIQEDFYLGEAIQEMSIPIIKMLKPAIIDFWAYPETGFHPLAVVAVNERYPKEALKCAFSILGEGQMSLTKVLIVVNGEINIRDINIVSKALWSYLSLEEGIHLLSNTSQDTLDFTGPSINNGSKLILLATDKRKGPLRKSEPKIILENIHPDIIKISSFGPSFLIVKVKDTCKDIESIRIKLCRHAIAKFYLFHILVSEDVPLNDKIMTLWGWFTRFDPLEDIYPSNKSIVGNRLLFEFPILINSRWKKGYPKPVEFDPSIERKIEEKRGMLGI